MRSIILVVVLGISACSKEEMMDLFASKEDKATAISYIERLRELDYVAIEQDIDPSLKGNDLREALERMAALIPEGSVTSLKVVGAHTYRHPDEVVKNLTFEYAFTDRWVLINVATREKGGKRTIVGLNVAPQATSLEMQNRFALAGRTVKHYAVLGATILAVLVTLVALVACVRTRLPGRKWPWILFILLGIGALRLDWTSGEMSFTVLALQLFSASASADLYGPWIISVSLPLGAVAFLIYRKVQLQQNNPQ